MKLRKCCIAVMSVLILAGCSGSERDNKMETVPISEARQQLASDMEELKRGDYPNLECDDFEPIFTDSDGWHTLHLINEGKVCELTGKELAQLMRDNYEEIKKYLGDELPKGDTEVLFRGNPDEYREVYDEEFLKRVEEGEYDGEGYFSMIYDNDTTPEGVEEVDEETMKNAPPHQYLMVYWNLDGKMLMTGTLKKKYPKLSDLEGEEEACYYSNCPKERLQKQYVMCDGNKVSVQEAIKMAEDYIDKNQYQDTSMKKVVKRISVNKIGEKNYMYYVEFVNVWNGIIFDIFGSLTSETIVEQEAENREVSYDIETISFVGKDEVENYTDYASGDIVEETGEAITKTITLKQALQQVSESIGTVSKYRIKSIALAYRKIIEVEDLIKNNESSAYPVWEIETVNLTDKKETRFYVDIRDGSIQADRFN